MEIMDILLAPFALCLILTGIHCYLGLHVVGRGVIFVDLALAQVAALGTTIALLMGYDLKSLEAYAVSLGFTIAAAAVFALGRVRDNRIPQEAIIGIVYAVCSGATILMLEQAPHGHEAIKSMLVGSILFVTWPTVIKTFLIYLVIGLIHVVLAKRFLLITTDPQTARQKGIRLRLWDFVFYASFGVVVTSSVRIAGILLVFCYLVVPAVCAMLFANRVLPRLLIGWLIGFLGSVLGIYASAKLDIPTGASIVTMFGVLLIGCATVYTIFRPRRNSLSED